MSGFSQINLARLAPPGVIKTPNFEALLSEMKAYAIEAMPELEPFLALESEPATKLLEVCAYFRMLDRLEFNDGARASMLALSTGTNLDHLAAFWGVGRLVIQAANDDVSPPIFELQENDDALRRRTQLSLDAHTTAGTVGSYTYWALTASGEAKDVAISSPVPGEVNVVILSHVGDGVASDALLSTVETTLNDKRPLTDLVTVASAEIYPYAIEAALTLYEGPGSDVVLAAARVAIDAYVVEHFQLGHDITQSGIYAALHRDGVQGVEIIEPAATLVIAANQAAFCTVQPTLTYGGRDV